MRDNGERGANLPTTRRRFISLLLGWSAFLLSMATSAAATLRFLVPNVLYEPPSRFKLGIPTDYPTGMVVKNDEQRLFIIHTTEGFQALSAICTHLRCVVNWDARRSVYLCPCHGSIFNTKGEVTGGPAPKPLEWYRITLSEEGYLVIDKRDIVDHGYILNV